MRIGRAGLALLLVAVSMPAVEAEELKPKFGDIGGVYYTDVSGNREACRQAIKNKIALCRQNTNFESNTKNRKYAGCLPVFRRQAQSCTVHFRHQMSKCDLSGAARITDFIGFSCEVTKTVVKEGGGPGIAPLDERMKARTGSNLRAGPGTNHRVVGSLRTGEEVRVTGRAGDWLRIAAPSGGTAFVHGSLLAAMAGPAPKKRAGGGEQDRGPAVNATQLAQLERQLAAARRAQQAAEARYMNLRRRHSSLLSWPDARVHCLRTRRTSDSCKSVADRAHAQWVQSLKKLKGAERDLGRARGRYWTLERRYNELRRESH